MDASPLRIISLYFLPYSKMYTFPDGAGCRLQYRNPVEYDGLN